MRVIRATRFGGPEVLEGAAERGVRVFGIDEEVSPADWRRFSERALELLASREVEAVIGQVVELERAADAHAAIAARSVAGKSLLRVYNTEGGGR